MDFNKSINLISKVYCIIKCLFWKNKNFVYVHSNIKTSNIESLRCLVHPSNSKYIISQHIRQKYNIKTLRKDFFYSKLNLFMLKRNISDNSSIFYTGFVTNFLSVFDGFVFGNNKSYKIIDYNNKYYSCDFKPSYAKQNFEINDAKEEINIIISSSYSIDTNKTKQVPHYIFSKPEPNQINNKYLNEVASFTKNVLDSCCNKNIKQVNLYIAAKQSVCFAVGTAIQKYHPMVTIYDFKNNEFKYSLNLKTLEIKEL